LDKIKAENKMKIDIKFDGKPGYGVYINELKEL